MFKKYCLILALLLTAAIIVGCGQAGTEEEVAKNPEESVTDVTSDGTDTEFGYFIQQELPLTFTEVMETCDCAAVATFVSYVDEGVYVEYTFSVKETLRGEVEDTIHVWETKGYTEVEESDLQYRNGEDIYTVGEDYVLLMQKNDSLFYEYPRYVIPSKIFIPATDPSKSTMRGESLAEVAGMDVNGIKNQIQMARATNAVSEKGYTTATDLPTIVAEADLVLRVEITGLNAEGEFANSNTYYCDVEEILKGGTVNTSEEHGDIQVTLMKESVEVGGTYVLLLNRIDETSILYTQSSLNSIIPSGDTETVREIQRLIEG